MSQLLHLLDNVFQLGILLEAFLQVLQFNQVNWFRPTLEVPDKFADFIKQHSPPHFLSILRCIVTLDLEALILQLLDVIKMFFALSQFVCQGSLLFIWVASLRQTTELSNKSFDVINQSLSGVYGLRSTIAAQVLPDFIRYAHTLLKVQEVPQFSLFAFSFCLGHGNSPRESAEAAYSSPGGSYRQALQFSQVGLVELFFAPCQPFCEKIFLYVCVIWFRPTAEVSDKVTNVIKQHSPGGSCRLSVAAGGRMPITTAGRCRLRSTARRGGSMALGIVPATGLAIFKLFLLSRVCVSTVAH